MGIKVVTSGTDSTVLTHTGYCHELTLVLSPDGTITPSTINLGNRGDTGITQLTFNLDNLISSNTINSDLDQYYGRVVIFDPTREVDRESSLMPNPMTYSLDSYTLKEGKWALPMFWTQYAKTYTFIFALVEKGEGGAIESETEIFVSKQFYGSVTDTSWSNSVKTAIENAVTIEDIGDAWAKPTITVSPDSSHYSISVDSTDLGVKLDRYVKRIQLDNSSTVILDEGLDVRYAVFWQDDSYYAIKFNDIERSYNTSVCWVPKQVSRVSGSWNFMIVAQTNTSALVSDFKRWVSNTLSLSITDNFLDRGDLGEVSTVATYFITGADASAPPSTGGILVETTSVVGDDAEGLDVTLTTSQYIWILNTNEGGNLQGYSSLGWADLDNTLATQVEHTPAGSSKAATYYAYRTTLYSAGDYKIRLTETK